MELKIDQNGEMKALDLPDDFTFTIERTNPFFSDEGDASVPATLPPTARNRHLLGDIDRIDINAPHYSEIPAFLNAGVWQKHGQLVVSTASRREGFDASLAIENSDIYTQFKDKTLKEMFADKTTDYGSVEAAVTAMQTLYDGNSTEGPLTIFPVAIAKYKDSDSEKEFYQYNNEINNGTLVWQARVVREGDDSVFVPDGYGISPFIYLKALMSELVKLMGYTNKDIYYAFPRSTSRFVVLNNCSDTICNGGLLKWEDLVPSITVSEFFEWLQNRFHIQPVVDSAAKTVEFVCMETILADGAVYMQADITNRVDGGWSIEINKPSHVVMTPTTDIEGAEPAAESFGKLLEKYGYYKEADEVVWSTIETTSNINYRDCLVLRRSTGEFFEVRRRSDYPNLPLLKRIGTNYFTYDRDNAPEAEQISQADTMPPMLCWNDARAVMPFIGERLNFHTTYNNTKEETEQKLMMVIEVVTTGLYFHRTGTTQKYIPGAVGGIAAHIDFNGTHNEDMYPRFWKRYNEQLRCGKTELTGIVRYKPAEAAMLDMTRPVFCGGQLLLPISTSIEVGNHTVCDEGKYFLVKNLSEMPEDEVFEPTSANNGLIWEFKSNMVARAKEEASETGETGWSIGNFVEGEFDFTGILPTANILGETSAKLTTTGTATERWWGGTQEGWQTHTFNFTYQGWFEAVALI